MTEWSRSDVAALLADDEWGRWGPDDQRGRANLITPDAVRRGTACVELGLSFSLSRPLQRVAPRASDGEPAASTTVVQGAKHGLATDYIGTSYHGVDDTHLDALCHVWGERGLWNGRDPATSVTDRGSSWADVTGWRHGLITRGVLLDVPHHRGTECVEQEEPVHGDELRATADAQGVRIEPGDALLVYCGREAWTETHGAFRRGQPRPGLHASCLQFLKDTDVSILCWDAMDAVPNDYDMPWTVHAAIWSMGLVLIDNALLQELADECRIRRRWEVLFMAAPLVVPGGTGSPINPIAVL
jgi:kynurenine formamidase